MKTTLVSALTLLVRDRNGFLFYVSIFLFGVLAVFVSFTAPHSWLDWLIAWFSIPYPIVHRRHSHIVPYSRRTEHYAIAPFHDIFNKSSSLSSNSSFSTDMSLYNDLKTSVFSHNVPIVTCLCFFMLYNILFHASPIRMSCIIIILQGPNSQTILWQS